MRTIEVLVEEESMQKALAQLLPKLIGGRAIHKIRNLGCKSKLLRLLPDRLAAYRERIQAGEDLRILVLVDRDDDDCMALKQQLESQAIAKGLLTKSNAGGGRAFHVVNRIAIEELEAWFIGDPIALRQAFTSLPNINPKTGIFRNPDNISGGTWEALHRYLKSHGVYRQSFPKIDAAQRIGAQLDPIRNRSRSFHAFVNAIQAMI